MRSTADASPAAAAGTGQDSNSMKAVVNHRYGTVDELRMEQVTIPVIGSSDMLVRVHAAAVNPLDWHQLTGTPLLMRLSTGLRRPNRIVRGVDMAGVVHSVGAAVTSFAPGDRVFAGARGAFADYVVVPLGEAVILPDDIDFADAAALPVAAVTALQGLRDCGGLKAGQSVLINGASGGVGTFAVQIAKAMGAHVTAVCSGANVDLVRSLGADRAIDYTIDDFTTTDLRYDVILDNIGNRPLSACRRILTDKGVYVIVGGPKVGKLLGPLKRVVAAKMKFAFASQRAVSVAANETPDELRALIDMMRSGTLRTVIGRRYPLQRTAEAIRHLEQGHARGKIIIDVVGGAT